VVPRRSRAARTAIDEAYEAIQMVSAAAAIDARSPIDWLALPPAFWSRALVLSTPALLAHVRATGDGALYAALRAHLPSFCAVRGAVRGAVADAARHAVWRPRARRPAWSYRRTSGGSERYD